MKKFFQSGVLLILILLVCSCSKSDLDLQADEYNKFVTERTEIIFDLGEDMGNEFVPYLKGETVDAVAVRAKYEEIKNKIYAVITDLREMRIPQSEVVAEFHKVLMSYLDLAEVQFSEDFNALVQLVEADNPASDEATTKFVSIIQGASKNEEEMLKQIKTAQRKMAKKHKFSITTGEAQAD